MSGATTQTLAGDGIINNLTINNAGNVSLANRERVYGDL